jgi:zinc transport system substrate-binding protein
MSGARRPSALAPLILCGLALLLLPGCPPAATSGKSVPGKPTVAVSIYPLSDWVRQVAGDAVDVFSILPPGANPHTFEPTPQIAEQAARASLRVVIGLGLDDWAQKLIIPSTAQTLVLSEGMETVPMLGDEPGEQNGPNPHLWMDPVRAAQMVGKLRPALEQIAPAQQAQIEQRGKAYQAQLQALGEELRQACQPYAGRQVITMHNAYDYFLQRCGLPPERVIAAFPGKEPSAQYLEGLGLWARQQKVHVIFAEPVFSPKAAEVLAREIQGQVLLLDDLGNPQDPERDSYVKLIRWDLQELLRGLAMK